MHGETVKITTANLQLFLVSGYRKQYR